MNSIPMDGSIATVRSAFETMGFTCTVQTDTSADFYYSKDTNHIAKFQVNMNTNYISFFNGSNKTGEVSCDFTNAGTLDYEKIGDSIVIGSHTTTLPGIAIAIVAPESERDDWQYYIAGNSSWNMVNGRTGGYHRAVIERLTTVSNVAQIIKMWDGSRFMDNVYIMVTGPELPEYRSGGNYTYVTIGDSRYFIVNIWDKYTYRSCMALKYPEA